MSNIQSNIIQVQQVINSMESVANSISDIDKSIEVACSTTVLGNNLAEKTMNKQLTIIDNLLSAFHQDIERVRTVSPRD